MSAYFFNYGLFFIFFLGAADIPIIVYETIKEQNLFIGFARLILLLLLCVGHGLLWAFILLLNHIFVPGFIPTVAFGSIHAFFQTLFPTALISSGLLGGFCIISREEQETGST